MVTKKDSSLLKKTQTPRSSERLWIKKKLFWIACIISAVFAVYLAEKTRLWIVTHGKYVVSFVCGTWASSRKYAKLRFQRDQGSDSLYLTCLNQQEYNDGDLIVISEKVLRAAAEDVR